MLVILLWDMSSTVAMNMSDSELEIQPESPESSNDDGRSNQKVFSEAEKRDIVDKDRFYTRLTEYYKAKSNKKPFTRESLNSLLEDVHIAKGKSFRKDRREYFILRTYDTAEVDGKPQVIRRNDNLPVIAFEDLYDIIFDFHIKTNHGGKTKLERAYKSGKVNVPRPATEIFLLCCKLCCAKRSAPKKTPTEKPKYIRGFSHKGQVDVVHFQSLPDGRYSMVLAYQDHYTKFMILRPLQNDHPEIIARELLDIFMMFGAPKILESHNGRYFVTKVLGYLNGMWSESIIGHGEPKESEMPSKSPEEIENLIRKWMDSNFSTNWAKGLNIVQWQENTTLNQHLGRCPYQALFGCTPRVELTPNALTGKLGQNRNSNGINTYSNNGIKNISNSYTDQDMKSELHIVDEDLPQEKCSELSCIKDCSLVCNNCLKSITDDCLLCEICAACIHSYCQKDILWDDSLKRNRQICNKCLSCDSDTHAFKRMKKENEDLVVD